MTFADPSALESAYRFSSSQYSVRTLFPAQAGRNPGPAKAGGNSARAASGPHF